MLMHTTIMPTNRSGKSELHEYLEQQAQEQRLGHQQHGALPPSAFNPEELVTPLHPGTAREVTGDFTHNVSSAPHGLVLRAESEMEAVPTIRPPPEVSRGHHGRTLNSGLPQPRQTAAEDHERVNRQRRAQPEKEKRKKKPAARAGKVNLPSPRNAAPQQTGMFVPALQNVPERSPTDAAAGDGFFPQLRPYPKTAREAPVDVSIAIERSAPIVLSTECWANRVVSDDDKSKTAAKNETKKGHKRKSDSNANEAAAKESIKRVDIDTRYNVVPPSIASRIATVRRQEVPLVQTTAARGLKLPNLTSTIKEDAIVQQMVGRKNAKETSIFPTVGGGSRSRSTAGGFGGTVATPSGVIAERRVRPTAQQASPARSRVASRAGGPLSVCDEAEDAQTPVGVPEIPNAPIDPPDLKPGKTEEDLAFEAFHRDVLRSNRMNLGEL